MAFSKQRGGRTLSQKNWEYRRWCGLVVLGRDVGAEASWVQLPAETLTQGEAEPSLLAWGRGCKARGDKNHRSVLMDWGKHILGIKKKRSLIASGIGSCVCDESQVLPVFGLQFPQSLLQLCPCFFVFCFLFFWLSTGWNEKSKPTYGYSSRRDT